jgi:hypothetical protein
MKYPASRVAYTLLMVLALLAPVIPLTSRAQEATPAAGVQTVADGIANPRGFTWGADGTMFLAGRERYWRRQPRTWGLTLLWWQFRLGCNRPGRRCDHARGRAPFVGLEGH